MAVLRPEATDTAEAVRPSRLPPGLRPASAGRRETTVTRADEWPTDLGTDLYHLADIRVWLGGLRDDLVRVAAPAPAVEAAAAVP